MKKVEFDRVTDEVSKVATRENLSRRSRQVASHVTPPMICTSSSQRFKSGTSVRSLVAYKYIKVRKTLKWCHGSL
jgi:hypothetical protein